MRKSFTAVILLLLLASWPAAEPLRPAKDNVARHRWNKRVIHISISQSLTVPNPNIKTGSDTVGAVEASLSAWQNAANINFQQSPSDKQSLSPSGFTGDGTSLITIAQTPENVLMFDRGASDASARTRVFVDRRGNITEADVVLNPFQQFSTDGTLGTYDLQSVLTHELGHLLGIGHSAILGATMHEEFAKNGSFGLQNRSGRTLSDSDVSAARSLYGPRADDEECCSTITGKLSAPAFKSTRGIRVWIEDVRTGAVAGESSVSADGTFQFGGLESGKYRVLAQTDTGRHTGADEIAFVDLAKNKSSRVNASFEPQLSGFRLEYAGLGGQLAELAVPLNPGRQYTVFLGGKKIGGERLRVGSNSPFIEVLSDTLAAVDYNDRISAVSVTVRVRPDAPHGDYSLFVQGENGVRRYLIGGITVEPFEDPMSLFRGSAY